MSTKKTRHRHSTYLAHYDFVKEIHKFNFARRPINEFTPSQKAAITRVYNKHVNMLREMRVQDRGIFKKLPSNQIRNLQRAGITKEGFQLTNKGIIIPGLRTSQVEKRRQQVRIRGKGKHTYIDISLPSKREIFLPYDKSSGISFPDFCRMMIDYYHPHWVMIQNESGSGRTRHDPYNFIKYAVRDLVPIINRHKKRYGKETNPFVGIWLVWGKSPT